MNILSVSYDQLHKFRYFFGSREVLISEGVDAVIHTASHGMSGNENLPAYNDISELQ